MKEFLLILALAGSHAYDAYYTNRNVNVSHLPGHGEYNPVERPFVHGTSWLIVAQGAQFGLIVGIQHKLRHVNRHDHLGERLADALVAAEVTDHAAAGMASQTTRTK